MNRFQFYTNDLTEALKILNANQATIYSFQVFIERHKARGAYVVLEAQNENWYWQKELKAVMN